MTNEELERIKKRAEAATIGWVSTDGVYVVTLDDDGKEMVVAECNNEANAYFIGEARQDIPRLIEEVERLKEIVLSIGRLNERIDSDSDFPAGRQIYDGLNDLEEMCSEEVRNERASQGLLLCEECLTEFKPESSISKVLCCNCVDKSDMERFGWGEDDSSIIDKFDVSYNDDDNL